MTPSNSRTPEPLTSSTIHGAQWPIDIAFDVAFVDAMAGMEMYNKHHYRPNSYLHKWWARRCGSTFRAILKGLVSHEAQQGYYEPGGLEGKIVLDPMLGGGTTLHEAIRLGANVVGVDVDPIPVLQARANLAETPLAVLEAGFAHLYTTLEEDLGPLFCTRCPSCEIEHPFRFTLYGLRRTCACGPVLLVDSLILRYEGGQPAVRLCSRCHRLLVHSGRCRCAEEQATMPLVERTQVGCATCGERYEENTSVPYYARYQPLVIVGHCPTDGLFFKEPDEMDLRRIASADAERWLSTRNLEGAFLVVAGPKSRDLAARGITSYLELFSSRQLRYLTTAIGRLSELEAGVHLTMALLLSTSMEFNSMLCGYKGARVGDRPGAIRHAFSYHAYTFPYLALENNPLFPKPASGTLQKLFHDRVRRARRWAALPRERCLDGSRRFQSIPGEVDQGKEVTDALELQTGSHRFLLSQGSAVDLKLPDDYVDFIVTDPPYFDSVQYSDLARFFHVWLQQMLPDGAHWRFDREQSAVAPGLNGNGHYTRLLSRILTECKRVLRKQDGRLIFTYHHWNPKGWASLTEALLQAGFELVNRYVVQSENPVSVHISGLRALTHDAILVLAPAGAVAVPGWHGPAVVDTSDSYQFCYDCATLLGSMLNEKPHISAIQGRWQTALS